MVQPLRIALQYEPPLIILEYRNIDILKKQNALYHHEIPLLQYIVNGVHPDIIVDTIQQEHKSILRHVSRKQLFRLIDKIFAHKANQNDQSMASLPQANYNSISDTQLRLVKERMDKVFLQHIIRPQDENYQYDKQVMFQTQVTIPSEWDEE